MDGATSCSRVFVCECANAHCYIIFQRFGPCVINPPMFPQNRLFGHARKTPTSSGKNIVNTSWFETMKSQGDVSIRSPTSQSEPLYTCTSASSPRRSMGGCHCKGIRCLRLRPWVIRTVFHLEDRHIRDRRRKRLLLPDRVECLIYFSNVRHKHKNGITTAMRRTEALLNCLVHEDTNA